MMKKLSMVLAAALAAGAISGTAYAAGNESNNKATFFLSMKADSSTAYISDDGETGEYRTMKSSNGAVVKAVIIDGSTYLPFRYISELAGWKQGVVAAAGNTVGNTFEYVNNDAGGKIKMCVDKKLYEKNVNDVFNYQVKGEEEPRQFSIRNIDGSLYMPLRYIADILTAKTDYDPSTGNIFFASSTAVMNEFVNLNHTLKFAKTVSNEYDLFDNITMYSEAYMRSDGQTISTVSADMGFKESGYSCVSRRLKNLYYIKDSDLKVYTKREDSATEKQIQFRNRNNQIEDFKVDMILTEGDNLWGITSYEDGGKAFRADFDGMNLEYVFSGEEAYNLMLKKNGMDKYVFFMHKDGRTIVRYNTETSMIGYVSVYDMSWGRKFEEVYMLTFDEDSIIYVDAKDGMIHFVPYVGNIYTDDSIRVVNEAEKVIDTYNRQPIGEIQSMNYDDINDILYFTSKKADGSSGLFYYDSVGDSIGCLRTAMSQKTRIALLRNGYNTYIVDNDGDKKNDVTVSYSDNKVTLNGTIELKR